MTEMTPVTPPNGYYYPDTSSEDWRWIKRRPALQVGRDPSTGTTYWLTCSYYENTNPQIIGYDSWRDNGHYRRCHFDEIMPHLLPPYKLENFHNSSVRIGGSMLKIWFRGRLSERRREMELQRIAPEASARNERLRMPEDRAQPADEATSQVEETLPNALVSPDHSIMSLQELGSWDYNSLHGWALCLGQVSDKHLEVYLDCPDPLEDLRGADQDVFIRQMNAFDHEKVLSYLLGGHPFHPDEEMERGMLGSLYSQGPLNIRVARAILADTIFRKILADRLEADFRCYMAGAKETFLNACTLESIALSFEECQQRVYMGDPLMQAFHPVEMARLRLQYEQDLDANPAAALHETRNHASPSMTTDDMWD